MYVPALVGLRRCAAVICVRGVQKHCVLQGFVGVEGPQFGSGEKQKLWVSQGRRREGAPRGRAQSESFGRCARVNTNGAKRTPR